MTFVGTERRSADGRAAFGAVEVGVQGGVAAYLDLQTKFGNVQSDLSRARRGPQEDVVEVQARTSFGDMRIHRTKAPV